MFTQTEFDAKLAEWINGASEIIKNYWTKMGFTAPTPTLTIMKGRRYLRIVRDEGSSRSAYAFIDTVNGDVLKAESWKAPANRARGNIFSSEWPGQAFASLSAFGPACLR